MTRGAAIVALLAALAAAPAAVQVRPSPGLGDPHIQAIDYNADQVVRLEGAPGYQLTVALAPDEQVETIAVGDTGAWQVTVNRGGDHLFVKLAQGSGATDMTVTTNVRHYVFELVALPAPTADMAYTVAFRYPMPATPSATVVPSGVVGRYRVTGARALRPSRISDDGQRTFVEWPKEAELPAVYARDGRGREALINGMMRADRLVIDAVAPALVFRIDRQVAYAERLKQASR